MQDIASVLIYHFCQVPKQTFPGITSVQFDEGNKLQN